jgi:hypothetical protein
VLLEAVVAEVHEQVGGAERPPGMVIKPKLEADAARSWWKQRVTVDPKTEPAGFTPAGEVERTAPAADADGKVTVVSRRKGDTAVPEIVDDGRNTSVMSVIDDSAAAVAAQEQGDPGVTDPSLPRMTAELAAQVPIEDDGKRTMMMDAVDLAALGLDPSASGSLPAITDEDSGASGGDSKKKKKKRR